jgi:class I fructose-bisphosphate aldolase/fructose-bisphosphate aldolase/2-amino-3,7-dideoxy-D-threo-hept-6-ulosonate synthase
MSGIAIKLGRLFAGGKNAVVIAADHGEFEGPIPGMVDISGALQKIYSGVDGILLSPGMIRKNPQAFAYKGAPLAIMRLNWSTTYCEEWGYHEAQTARAISAMDALAYGADVALVSLTLKSGSEGTDARNVEIFCSLTREAHACGMPVIGEYFPAAYQRLSSEELGDEIRKSTRILAELGADAIKTFYTINFKKVVEGCPIPILGLGGEKKPTVQAALKLAHDIITGGARGVVFGRNALQAAEPLKFQRALCRIVKDGLSVEAAIDEFKLDIRQGV